MARSRRPRSWAAAFLASAAVLAALIVAFLAATALSFGAGGEAQILAPGVLGASATTAGTGRS